jgi:hypothetical protein
MVEDLRGSRPTAGGRLDTDAIERAVLGHLLDLFPVQLTLDELVREMTDASDDFAARDAIERAVLQLARTGLLHRRSDGFVVPTRAALRFLELFGG